MPSLEKAKGPTRVIAWLPTARDGEITAGILAEHDIDTHLCRDMQGLCDEVRRGVGVILIAEEHLLQNANGSLRSLLDEQPPWSDIPIVVLTARNEVRVAGLRAWQQSANVTLAPRPVNIEHLVAVTHSRIRDRKRQYVVKKLLTSLEEQRREFQQLANSMPQIVFVTDRKGGVEFLNDRAREYSQEDALTSSELPFSLAVHSGDRQALVDKWKKSLHTGKSFYCEFRARRDVTGKHRWQLARAEPAIGADGSIYRWYGTCTDIHDRKLGEQALDSALQAAQAANVAKSEFLANMSHEIRTPMTAILGYTEVLRESEFDDERRQWIEVIQRNGEFLLGIINDILDLSKIESGKLELVTLAVDLRVFATEIKDLLNVRAQEKGVVLTVEVAESAPAAIHCDDKRLRQILVNLVGNALKFTDEGEVALHISSADEVVRFVVSDTGIGMTNDQLQLLFKPFNQGDASVARRYGGSGLGLAISQRLAKMLGGCITAESVLGQGSSFTLEISAPAINSIESPLSAPAVIVEDARTDIPQNCNIVVVDDRRDVRFLTGHILGRAGAKVEYAENGEEAIQLIHLKMSDGVAPDIVLMDMQMPVMDGYRATKELRASGFGGPIVALTADAMHGDMAKCLDSGCNAYLSKPIDTQQLLQVVSKHVGRSA